MTLHERQRHNDTLRTTLQGATVYFTPAVMELEPRIRGRLLYRLSLYDTFHPDSDHSQGVIIFAGFSIWFVIKGDTLTVGMNDEL